MGELQGVFLDLTMPVLDGFEVMREIPAKDPMLPIVRWFGNSLIIATIGTGIIVFLSTLSGYAFARLEFPGKGPLFSLLLFSLMIPAAVTLIPVFLLLRDLKMLNTFNSNKRQLQWRLKWYCKRYCLRRYSWLFL